MVCYSFITLECTARESPSKIAKPRQLNSTQKWVFPMTDKIFRFQTCTLLDDPSKQQPEGTRNACLSSSPYQCPQSEFWMWTNFVLLKKIPKFFSVFMIKNHQNPSTLSSIFFSFSMLYRDIWEMYVPEISEVPLSLLFQTFLVLNIFKQYFKQFRSHHCYFFERKTILFSSEFNFFLNPPKSPASAQAVQARWTDGFRPPARRRSATHVAV